MVTNEDNYVTDELSKIDSSQSHYSIIFVMAVRAFSTLFIAAIVCVTFYCKMTISTKKKFTPD